MANNNLLCQIIKGLFLGILNKSVYLELPLAIRAAPNPTCLVLDCVRRFYMQGKKAYSKDRILVQARRACVLALESFLLAFEEEIKIDKEVRKQAEEGAMSWRKRLISEGALSGTCDMDARGLLLLRRSRALV